MQKRVLAGLRPSWPVCARASPLQTVCNDTFPFASAWRRGEELERGGGGRMTKRWKDDMVAVRAGTILMQIEELW